jgi:DtxR family Mn-dependent transcriptional regulator
MFRHLQKSGLLVYDKGSGACLTETGQRIARKMVRKHRLVETFLKEVLRLDDGILHDEAERLEHVISDRLMNRIDAYLGFPQTDPHGSPIPGQEEEREPQSLSELDKGQSFRLHKTRVKPKMNQYYERQGFLPDSLWTLQEHAPDQSSFLVSDGRRFLAIDGNSARNMLVFVQK